MEVVREGSCLSLKFFSGSESSMTLRWEDATQGSSVSPRNRRRPSLGWALPPTPGSLPLGPAT